MKKFTITMVVLIFVGALVSGIGCAVYFGGGTKFFAEDVEYVAHAYIAEQAFHTFDFSLKTSHNVSFVQGDEFSVKYSDCEQSPINISVSDGKVTMSEQGIDWKQWWKQLRYRYKSTDVIITVPEGTVLTLQGTVDGSANVELPDWNFGRIDLRLRGSANLKGTGVKTQDVNFQVAGSANVNMSGEFKKVSVDASGSARVALTGNAESMKTYASGSADLICNGFVCPLIELEASGSVDLDISGQGDALTVHASGSADIKARNFALKTARLNSSGSLDAQVSVSEYLYVSSSGSAHVDYWGNPSVERSCSGSCQIRKMD